MTVVVRRPGGPLAGLVTSITYRTGEQPRTSVEKILPSPETGLWVNLNRDAFRSFGWSGDVRQVPGTMLTMTRFRLFCSDGLKAPPPFAMLLQL